jgi:hypothetical protein
MGNIRLIDFGKLKEACKYNDKSICMYAKCNIPCECCEENCNLSMQSAFDKERGSAPKKQISFTITDEGNTVCKNVGLCSCEIVGILTLYLHAEIKRCVDAVKKL